VWSGYASRHTQDSGLIALISRAATFLCLLVGCNHITHRPTPDTGRRLPRCRSGARAAGSHCVHSRTPPCPEHVPLSCRLKLSCHPGKSPSPQVVAPVSPRRHMGAESACRPVGVVPAVNADCSCGRAHRDKDQRKRADQCRRVPRP
jgi:hypothetical protein